MQSAILDQARPAMWRIESGGQGGGDILQFGRNRIALTDIASVSAEEIRDRPPVNGLLLGAVAFVVVACALAYGVFDAEMRTRFLLGTVFLGFLGFVGLFEITNIRPQSLYEVRIVRRSGGTAVFVSPYRDEIAQLMARIDPAL